MDYEKKYNEALELARDYYKANLKLDKADENLILETIFPELTKSEDEKIRQKFIKLVKMSNEVGGFALHKWEADEMLAWLEKQKEPELSEDLGEYITELNKQFPEVSFAKLSRIAVRVKNWLEKQSNKNTQVTLPTFTFEDVLALECSMKTAKITKGGDKLYEMLVRLYDKIHNVY